MALVTLEATLRNCERQARAWKSIFPDEAAETAFSTYGGMFAPAVAPPAARAAREQGRAGGRTPRRFLALAPAVVLCVFASFSGSHEKAPIFVSAARH